MTYGGKFLLSCGLVLAAAWPAAAAEESVLEPVVITASKWLEPAARTPEMISVVSGDQLRARNATDLRAALAFVAGVEIGAGGDDGPASSVPAMWGLREFDAFLLVVDGVPWGGAFNPDLATLDLTDVERIEVLRGSAPVMYGATSFVGVIHVIHYAPGAAPTQVSVAGGTPGSARLAASFNLPAMGEFQQSLTANGDYTGLVQDRTHASRVHALYRAAGALGAGQLRINLDGVLLRQDPASPVPREGTVLSLRLPRDANTNPADARRDRDRIAASVDYALPRAHGSWEVQLSLSHTSARNTQGFLRSDFATDGVTVNADGYRQQVELSDVYADVHRVVRRDESLTLVAGVDWLHGNGHQRSDNFEYAVRGDGRNAPSSAGIHIDESTYRSDRRDFSGVYAQLDWRPVPQVDVLVGARYNRTDEKSHGALDDRNAPAGTPTELSDDQLGKRRGAFMVGANWTTWSQGRNRFAVFGNVRDTYKPAAVDFGPEAEGGLLQPETARSSELGFKGKLADGRLSWEAAAFRMNFNNLVIVENIGGLPGLTNAGRERMEGFEVEAEYRATEALLFAGSYANHDARFTDYARDTGGGVLEQLAGNRLELSPRELASFGMVYGRPQGLLGSLAVQYVGSRYLNKRNTALAGGYTTIDAGVGYRFGDWTIRLDSTNLTNRRDPVTESEIGDASFYRLQGAAIMLSARWSTGKDR